MYINECNEKKFSNMPVKVLQIGEGNFLKAFVDYAVEKMNINNGFNGSVVIMQPKGNKRCDVFLKQNNMFTIVERGRMNGKVIDDYTVITSVKECINPLEHFERAKEYINLESLKIVISNTTEAGIVFDENETPQMNPPKNFPAKLTLLLYERYLHFGGDVSKGLYLLPVELIENNGEELKKVVLKYCSLWGLSSEFQQWINNACTFCSTLVDRIVTGYPKSNYEEIRNKIGYDDELVTVTEPYFSWIIEDKKDIKTILPLEKANLNVVWSNNLSLYRERKVKILNGAHTMSVLGAFLSGHNIVREMMNDTVFFDYIKAGLFNEIIPTINLPKSECEDFAKSVFERFDNPYIDHRLLDISLNSVAKFKARCLPSIQDYYNEFDKCPKILAFAMASLIKFYDVEFENEDYYGVRNNEKYIVNDYKSVLDYFLKNKKKDIVKKVLSNADFWGEDLSSYDGFLEEVEKDYFLICNNTIKNSIKEIL